VAAGTEGLGVTAADLIIASRIDSKKSSELSSIRSIQTSAVSLLASEIIFPKP
jgi:hypothetical protein